MAAAQPQTPAAAPVSNMLGAQPAAATTTPSNPRQVQTQFETDVKTLGAEREALGKLGVDVTELADVYRALMTMAADRKVLGDHDVREAVSAVRAARGAVTN